ncbi:hypothetical protein NPS01_16240 [Nocardioides psychrotolerans]|uniref:Uncharacterized protein n=2 Tax=Nocardioides psychrotolerans TaxID=1005945 RepID=A0A1I3EYJ6_9ACTN|nr:hypothetical protein NPS01_16240 [Nocardioides psychrotolerans]SFI03631.1 hypothetical protein SAMN05216561_104117 [Nocardioides psychrotolerans]
MTDGGEVSISMTSDEALVLFDLLHRWEDDEQVTPPQNEAEQIALWAVSALIERVLVEPFGPDYSRLVSEARTRLTPTD